MANVGEIKQGVINAETVQSHQHKPSRIRIQGFSGSYRGVQFDDQGQSVTEVDQEFIENFRKDFPKSKAVIEQIALDTPIARKIIPGTSLG